ncbi:MAG: glucose-6-phosphate dehydrogenase [Kiritimatiellia bacterium]|nr:glucose-6-phosphate dehydrogenase [Kiritimatiellia bacterium]
MSDASNHLNDPLTVVIMGASGDLARTKIIPALYALYCQGYLPKNLRVVGYARSEFSDDAFRRKLAEHLKRRSAVGVTDCSNEFLSCCSYCQGSYAWGESYQRLLKTLDRLEGAGGANRMFYLAIPPAVFLDVTRAIGQAGLAQPAAGHWSRVVVEKPFGSDRASSDQLVRDMAAVFSEDQTYRIDHYLGKELIHNLLVLRFANLIFEPIWNRNYIDHVQITWKENIGVGDRGGYYDGYGIIRDVIQNHLLQIMALTAMEPPSRPDAAAIRGKTVELLRDVPPVRLDDMVLGQYTGAVTTAGRQPAYLEEPNMPPDSRTPTYAATVMHVNNWRWDGVPFFMRAGKALETKLCEVRLCFKQTPANIFRRYENSRWPDELVIRIQPDETIYFKIINKVPGLKVTLAQCQLDMQYSAVFTKAIPDAYECLLLDVLEGEKTMFVSTPELAALWDVFTPVLHDIDERQIRPDPYPSQSRGPAAADALIERYGRKWAN